MLTARDGFAQVLAGEWTKFRTVRSTAWCVLAAVVLTVLLSVFAASASRTNANQGPRYVDHFHFLHQPLNGDGSVTARVVSQEHSQEWAKAGVMIKAGAADGSPYAAIMITPDHGIRLQSTFDTDLSVGPGGAPLWLRLTRTGNSVTGFQSTDGNTWREVGTVNVGALPRTAEAGLFVTSPPNQVTAKVSGGSETRPVPTTGTAVFDNVSGTSLEPDRWIDDDIVAPDTPPADSDVGSSTEAGGTFTLTGRGDVAGYGIESWRAPGDDDIVRNALGGVQIGLMAVIALGVLFATSEYKTGTIRTTFTASPRRVRVLTAKAVILGVSVFLAGLIASVVALYASRPVLESNGYAAPAYPPPSLADGPVLRAVIGTALFLAVLAVFSFGVGVIRRRTVGAIVIVVALIVVPQIVAPIMSLNAELWINRLTPVAGLAIQQTRERFDTAIGPWTGFAVLCVYAAAALAIAMWRLRERDA